jgi:hypothetical protein
MDFTTLLDRMESFGSAGMARCKPLRYAHQSVVAVGFELERPLNRNLAVHYLMTFVLLLLDESFVPSPVEDTIPPKPTRLITPPETPRKDAPCVNKTWLPPAYEVLPATLRHDWQVVMTPAGRLGLVMREEFLWIGFDAWHLWYNREGECFIRGFDANWQIFLTLPPQALVQGIGQVKAYRYPERLWVDSAGVEYRLPEELWVSIDGQHHRVNEIEMEFEIKFITFGRLWWPVDVCDAAVGS